VTGLLDLANSILKKHQMQMCRTKSETDFVTSVVRTETVSSHAILHVQIKHCDLVQDVMLCRLWSLIENPTALTHTPQDS